jgi:hypothetical protein
VPYTTSGVTTTRFVPKLSVKCNIHVVYIQTRPTVHDVLKIFLKKKKIFELRLTLCSWINRNNKLPNTGKILFY